MVAGALLAPSSAFAGHIVYSLAPAPPGTVLELAPGTGIVLDLIATLPGDGIGALQLALGFSGSIQLANAVCMNSADACTPGLVNPTSWAVVITDNLQDLTGQLARLTVNVGTGPGEIRILSGTETTNTEEDAPSTPQLLARTMQVTPEPTALVLLGIALGGLAFARRPSLS
jgi:hypothetical protein